MTMKDRIKKFEEHRKAKKLKKKSDKSIERAFRQGQDLYRDWNTDAYRSQSGKREVDVVPIN